MENLTENELTAKNYLLRILTDASKKPCDESRSDIQLKLPEWYDEEKYKRGQKYFADNRFGILIGSFFGLMTLLSDAKGLNILKGTNRSSDAESAKKRYLFTLFHLMTWYQDELKPGSKSWTSIHRIRKMHLYASNASVRRQIGCITQNELSFTVFGFIGYSVLKPHLLSIHSDKIEDRDGFIHFWAVITCLLGVDDQYNYCLHPYPVVVNISQLWLQYFFAPLLTVETETFVHMITAISDGFSKIIFGSSFSTLMFFVRRLAGLPGYQYKQKRSSELYHSKQVFSKNDFQKIREALSDTRDEFILKIVLLSENKINFNEDLLKEIYDVKSLSFDSVTFEKLSTGDDLNDTKFYELNTTDQYLIKRNCFFINLMDNWWGRQFCEAALSVALKFVHNYVKDLEERNCTG